jgi:hypothetical protein
MKLSDIVAHMRRYYEGRISSNRIPYLYLRYAAGAECSHSRWPTAAIIIEQRIRTICPGLNTVEVVNSVVASDIADRAAKKIIEWAHHKAEQVRAVFGWVSWAAARSWRCVAP